MGGAQPGQTGGLRADRVESAGKEPVTGMLGGCSGRCWRQGSPGQGSGCAGLWTFSSFSACLGGPPLLPSRSLSSSLT